MCYFFFFFFSSRRRHTRCLSDWSSDVCSSDLDDGHIAAAEEAGRARRAEDPDSELPEARAEQRAPVARAREPGGDRPLRSEERRVGKECRSRWWAYH